MEETKELMQKESEEQDITEAVDYIRYAGLTINQMDSIGYFSAPASASHHLAKRGGLAKHSVNVTKRLLELSSAIGVPWSRRESPYIVGMLHDVVKCRCYKFEIDEDSGEENIIRVPHPYSGHGAASVAIIACELGFALHPDEASAIFHHMGAFNLTGYDLKDFDHALGIFPLQIIATHTADMLAARFDEENTYSR